MVNTIIFPTSASRFVGLIVRGKLAPDHHPGKLEQHADCILPNGAPVGFFGESNNASGNSIGLRMQGTVYDHAKLKIHRPYYVDRQQAVAARVVSTVLLIQVDVATANAFTRAWSDMTLNPGNFNIVGGNCSSHASAAFIEAKILTSGIPGMDTPDNLYGQLVKKLPAAKLKSITGFFGFVPKGTSYVMEWETYTHSPQANEPGAKGGRKSSTS